MWRVLLGACALAAVAAPPARAAYVAPGAQIVSASLTRLEQADDTSSQPDVSADGRYVVFKTVARNLFPDDLVDPPGQYYAGGVFRRDLATGALDLVAPGDLRRESDDAVVATGASAPSVSRDGRYVVFYTGAALVPWDTNGATDVYVRDMDKPRGDPQAYDLVSAKDGGDTVAQYVKPDPDRPLRDPGADVSPGTAISDDGRMVAFSVREQATDLPDHATTDVPAGQILVRDRTLKRTSLVTTVRGSSPPRPIDANDVFLPAALGSVVLSADGSTVAWAGQLANQQTAFLSVEAADPRTYYYLWRRVADGPGAPTRRVTGPADLDDPACDGMYSTSPVATGPCYGPLANNEQTGTPITGTPPALSGDGWTVAFLASGPPRGVTTGTALDLFVTSMAPGVSRKAGTVELTREGTGRDPLDSAQIGSVALSEDGRWLALTTQRTRFLLPALQLLGGVRSTPGFDDLYLVDLVAHTVQRAVRSLADGDPSASIQAPVSLSADGRRIVFASGADNLFFGDANQRPDVFAVDRLDAAPPAPVEQEPPVDDPGASLPPPAPAPKARLTVHVARAAAGKVRLRVQAPAKGTIRVQVRGKAPDRDGVQRGAAKLLAQRSVKAKKKGGVTVDVTLAKRYRTGLRRAGTLTATASVRFAPVRGAALERAISVRFKAKP